MLFNHFTWTQYLITLGVLLVIYYAVIAAKYYVLEITSKLNSHRSSSSAHLSVLQYEQPVLAGTADDPLIQQTEQLISEVKQAISRNYSQDRIQKIFQKFKDIKDTQLQAAINELVVTECEKTGVALLTEAEVNKWWEG